MRSDTLGQRDQSRLVAAEPGNTDAAGATQTTQDPTGRQRLAQNVLASWGGHMIFVIMGFLLPRMIDQQLGVTALGIWDFGWALVSYFDMAQFGVGSSVSYYVATSRTAHNDNALNTAVSSAMGLQVSAALIIVALTLGTIHVMPTVFHARLGEHLNDARWVVLFLGLSIAVQVACDSFRGVMTGCHHWGLHNAINAGAYAANAGGMLVVLLLGGGLAHLACAYFSGTLVAEIIRAIATFHISPELRLRWQHVNREQVTDMLTYGGKTVLGVLSSLLLYQTTNLLITAQLGAAALALYSRPMALVRQCSTFVDKFAYVLSPTASSMHAGRQQGELRRFFLQSIQYSAYLTLPPVLMLSILGDSVLRLWMGDHYSHSGLIAILAWGHVMSIVQTPIWSILRGVNKHGFLAAARIIAALFAIGFTILALGPLHGGLVGAAIALTIPLTVLDGVIIPLYACRQLNLSLIHYWMNTWLRPLLCVLPFACCLGTIRILVAEKPSLVLLYGLTVGGAVLGLTYWRWVVPKPIRDRVKCRLGNFLRIPILATQRLQK